LGEDTYFSIGIDENSQHVLRAAEAHGVEVRQWVDQINASFLKAWGKLNISNDYWIRTTEERHIRASQEMFRRAQEKGDIYKATYAGWYCPNCNTFYSS
jgi:methionyl-tRNA synthetase